MSIRAFCALLALVVLTLAASAAGPDDMFVNVYNLLQSADSQRELGRSNEARRSYLQCQDELKKLQRAYPTWNERVINYRLRYVAEKLEALKPLTENATSESQKEASSKAESTPPSSAILNQFNSLNDQIQKLVVEKQSLEAKLREALSAQPAPIDPRELQRAIDRISVLQSTNKTLLDQLEQQQNERRNLVEKVVAEEAQRALAEANQQLQSQRKTTSLLQREKADIEAQLTKIQDADLKQVKSENISLKAQVSELTSDTERGRQIADLSSKLSRLQSSLEEAQQRNGALAIEKSALEKQLADAQARVEEEGIVKISKLEVDLAVARADAGRNSLRAEELVGALQRERLSRTELENKNQQLETRIAALGNDTKDVPETLNSLQQALGIEKAERTQIESQLKAAELQIVALQSFRTPNATVTRMNLPQDLPRAPTAEHLQQLTASQNEAKQLRILISESKLHETEIRAALAEEQTLRSKLDREKQELLKRLAEKPATTDAASDRRLALLDTRVKELEGERNELKQRLRRVSGRAMVRIDATRSRTATPRERAVEFRLVR